MSNLRIRTARLELVAGTAELLTADLAGNIQLAKALEVTVPTDWPPDLYDPPAVEYSLKLLRRNSLTVGWNLWYLIVLANNDPSTLAGIAGFRGTPTVDGTVEIGYSLLSEFHRQGYATEAVSALIQWALTHPKVQRIIAETLPGLKPSIRVLEKNGFHFAGPGSEPGIIRYERLRAE